MNGSEIHWLSILYWTLGSAFVLLITLVVVSPCVLSSKISRDEEDRELRANLGRMDRAA